ncbi:MAG: hypothetical protein CM1200mP3_09800 [Chloroflexota bacterium]|nr:MAG: hypothetical protein CM1200mP3_09800 [Chloroflexota bacterium]
MLQQDKTLSREELPENWKDEKEGYGQNFLPVTSAGAYIPGGQPVILLLFL